MKNRTLTPAEFHILLALSVGRLHGLGIAQEAEELSRGTVVLGPGTLYRSLKVLARDGLVKEVTDVGEHEDPRRKYYHITPAGRTLLGRDVDQLAHIVQVARKRNLSTEAAGG